MFRRLTEANHLSLTITVDGAAAPAQAGDSVAAAMLAAGRLVCRTTPVSGAPRAPYCLMGACFDCLVTIDGMGNRQACMTPVRNGMRIETQRGKRDAGESDAAGAQSLAPQYQVVQLRERYDVAVVGAGPAGLAAAGLCARMGLDCVLLDEQAQPGGQIFRSITNSPMRTSAALGGDYWRGAALARTTLASGVHYVAGATVWGLLREGEIALSVGGAARLIRSRRIILATGAVERPFPIPGWTLPGVMPAGGAQVLLKSSALVPARRTVLAGCGPLLWLLAWQYLQAGVHVEAILDTTPRANWARALPHAAAFAASPYFAKGLRLMRAVRREVRVIGGIVALAAQGNERLEAVAYRTQRGNEKRLPADVLLLHQGVVPNGNLAMSANVTHRWSDAQLCWTPMVDDYGATNVPGLAIAGDGAGIAGAEAAEARGQLAAVAAVRAVKPHPSLAAEEKAARASLRRFARGRAFLDLLYRPAPQFRRPDGETLVCRCEEVRAKDIAEAAALGCPGPNQLKAFLRCGMGPCQGRLCNLTVTELMAKAHSTTPAGDRHLSPAPADQTDHTRGACEPPHQRRRNPRGRARVGKYARSAQCVLRAFHRTAQRRAGRTAAKDCTFAAKDLFDIEGHVTGAGNPDWLALHAPALRTAPVVQRLVDAGAGMVGKTHTDELSRGIFGENAHYGTPINPRAADRVPGGSSSGSAAAVAGGLVDFALGTDTGGSVRIPASFCGIYGIRPTHGRVPLEGVVGQAPSFDTIGWFARDGDLLARVGEVLLGVELRAAREPRHLIVASDAFAVAEPETARALAPAVERLSSRIGNSENPACLGDGTPCGLVRASARHPGTRGVGYFRRLDRCA